MKVLSFSLLASVLLASVAEQAEPSLIVQEVEQVADVGVVQQENAVEEVAVPVIVITPVQKTNSEELLDSAINEMAEDEKLLDEVLKELLTEDKATAVVPEENKADSIASRDEASEDESMTLSPESEASQVLSPESEPTQEAINEPQVLSLDSQDELIVPSSQLTQRKPAQPHSSSPSTSSSIEEIDIRRPQVPDDIRIWPILCDIISTPFVMEMITYSTMILFVIILFSHVFSNY